MSQQPGFHSEWITIDEHRILLSCRTGFPTARHRLIAQLAVEVCASEQLEEPRVVSVYFDDKSSTWITTFASTNPDNAFLADRLNSTCHHLYHGAFGQFEAVFEAVKPGDATANRYHHMHYLSTQTGTISLDS